MIGELLVNGTIITSPQEFGVAMLVAKTKRDVVTERIWITLIKWQSSGNQAGMASTRLSKDKGSQVGGTNRNSGDTTETGGW